MQDCGPKNPNINTQWTFFGEPSTSNNRTYGGFTSFDEKRNTSLIRGWAIIDRDDLPSVNDKLTNLLLHHGATNLQLVCQERKGFSASKIIIRIVSSQTFI